jgi:hypothetical protein
MSIGTLESLMRIALAKIIIESLDFDEKLREVDESEK